MFCFDTYRKLLVKSINLQIVYTVRVIRSQFREIRYLHFFFSILSILKQSIPHMPRMIADS
jgi:hypothetical protein